MFLCGMSTVPYVLRHIVKCFVLEREFCTFGLLILFLFFVCNFIFIFVAAALLLLTFFMFVWVEIAVVLLCDFFRSSFCACCSSVCVFEFFHCHLDGVMAVGRYFTSVFFSLLFVSCRCRFCWRWYKLHLCVRLRLSSRSSPFFSSTFFG